ncbi:Hypothetical predicted protein [Lecanosticta acicola]|uniref:Uncharacterized protein n=1 Tax=Lecanosticta acicola TaxID=111012 RepID=A0AAI9EB92_9PEZI|nr:Hypothetical predicted protein [Lecanosticta acicola]
MSSKESTRPSQDIQMDALPHSSEEEGLPLYSEYRSPEEDADCKPPSNAASPAEVRAFFRSLLVSHCHYTPAHAESTSALWTRGSGRELRSYPPAMYLTIFGAEDGWILYRETKMALHREARTAEKARKRYLITTPILILWTLCMVPVILYVTIVPLVLSAVLSSIVAILWLLIASAIHFLEPRMEDQIENELKRCMQKGDQTSGS